MSAGLARVGEATVGEAMPVDAGETGVGRSRAESEAEATSPGVINTSITPNINRSPVELRRGSLARASWIFTWHAKANLAEFHKQLNPFFFRLMYRRSTYYSDISKSVNSGRPAMLSS